MEQREYNHVEIVKLQAQGLTRGREKGINEIPTYHAPQVFVIDKAIRLMKNDASGSLADAGGWYTYGT